MVGSVPTGVMKEAHGIKDLQREEQKTKIEGAQKRAERLSLKVLQGGVEGTTHITESALRDEAQDIEDQLQQEHKTTTQGVQKGVERLSLEGVQGGLEGTTHVTETAVRGESQDIKDQLEEELQGTDRRRLASAGGTEAVAGQLNDFFL